MAPTMQPQSNMRLELNLPKKQWPPDPYPQQPKTASEWFATKFPDATSKYGCPFLEMRETSCDGFSKTTPVTINTDFFAAMLGGDQALGHQVLYFEPEMQFYYREPILQLYKPTTAEKLQNFYRAMLIRCAQETSRDVDKLNLFHEFRNDKNSKAVTQRAKSILAADSSFFSATSPNQRVKGPELHDRLMRVLVETMLEPCDAGCLTVTEAYQVFCHLTEQRNLGQLKRSLFKVSMQDLVRAVHGLGLRRDVPDESGKQQEAWKGLRVVAMEPLAA